MTCNLRHPMSLGHPAIGTTHKYHENSGANIKIWEDYVKIPCAILCRKWTTLIYKFTWNMWSDLNLHREIWVFLLGEFLGGSNLRGKCHVCAVHVSHCNSLQLTVSCSETHCNSLQLTATHCNSQWVAVSCSELQWAAVSCSESHWVAVSRSESQWVAVRCSPL